MVSMNPAATLKAMREKKPLVHHITNWVTINDCAQITRHWGALPVMAHAKEEVAEMVGLASALVLNIGTLTMELVDAMVVAARAANKKGIPVVVTAHAFKHWDDGSHGYDRGGGSAVYGHGGGSAVYEMVGGDAMRYWSKTIVYLEKTGKTSERKATIMKHRSREEDGSVKFMLVDDGIKPSRGMLGLGRI